jgi:hypothetical protein
MARMKAAGPAGSTLFARLDGARPLDRLASLMANCANLNADLSRFSRTNKVQVRPPGRRCGLLRPWRACSSQFYRPPFTSN